MNNPSDEQIKRLQFKIADLQGWRTIKWQRPILHALGDPEELVGYEPDGNFNVCPNWLTDRNASWGLVKDFTVKEEGLYLGHRTAQNESMGYLNREGWRWVDCETCAVNTVRSTGIASSPIGDINPCPACKGEKGEWVQ